MYSKTMTFIFAAVLFLSFISCSSVESYIEKDDYVNADKYCSELKGEDQTKCMRTIADSYFNKLKDYSKSADYYKKIGDTAMYEKSISENAIEFVNKKDYQTAGQMFCSIKKYDWFKSIQDNDSEEIKQLKEIDKNITDYNKLKTEKSGRKYFTIYNEVDSIKKDFVLQVNKAASAGTNMSVLSDVNARLAYSNKRLKELYVELAKLPKKDKKEGESIQKRESAIISEIKKIHTALIPKGKGYSDTAKGYAEQYTGDFTK